MKAPNNNIFLHIATKFSFLLLLTTCDIITDKELKTDLDITRIAFPPKLSVTALLDGGSGEFTVLLRVGRSMADYKEPQPIYFENIRNGEIRLFEDGTQILYERGIFDISRRNAIRDPITHQIVTTYYDGYEYRTSGLQTKSGSVYRLEVEVEGYNMVVSTATMPATPVVVSADIDNTTFYYFQSYRTPFIPVSVHLENPKPERGTYNYYALEMNGERTYPEYPERNSWFTRGFSITDMSLLEDTPKNRWMQVQYENYGFVSPEFLLVSDNTLTKKNASFSLYTLAPYRSFILTPEQEEELKDDPQYVKTTHRFQYIFTVKHITSETFKYCHRISMQRDGVDFFTEPVIISGNIENGYGIFSVFNSVSIDLLEYETDDWLYIGK